jgi:hypothetical protein
VHTTVPWIAGQTVAKGIHDYFVAAVHMHPFFRKQQAVQRGIKEHAMAICTKSIQQRHNMCGSAHAHNMAIVRKMWE